MVKVDLCVCSVMLCTSVSTPHFALTPLSMACLAILADRDMSSYELLVQLPINAIRNLIIKKL